MIYQCSQHYRRQKLIDNQVLNGIDYLEVIDHDLPDSDSLRQRTLLVHCFKPLPATVSEHNVLIEGGERVTVGVAWAAPASPLPSPLASPVPPDSAAAEAATIAVIQSLTDGARTLVVRTTAAGDFSTYTLRLVNSTDSTSADDDTLAGFDPCMCAVDFKLKVQCPTDFDCQPTHTCLLDETTAPDIDYLAKDYPTLRRLILNRIAQLSPRWQQDSEADTGLAVVELLAYVCDQLSYQQDAVGTEAYLDTARRRISVRRHAALVDYLMHEGCNARAWVHVEINATSVDLDLQGLQFLTRCPGLSKELPPASKAYDEARLLTPLVFEAVCNHADKNSKFKQTLYASHNKLSFYTWGDDSCCLPAGATSATLAGKFTELLPDEVLLFEERLGPKTGQPGDADPAHRHVVRLSKVSSGVDPLYNLPVTHIQWHAEDALPFPLCVSSVINVDGDETVFAEVSVARGNMVLVDHGKTIRDEALPVVPSARQRYVVPCCADASLQAAATGMRFNPVLAKTPLTHAVPLPADASTLPASSLVGSSANAAVAQLGLATTKSGALDWTAVSSLLGNGELDPAFVAEVDDDGRAWLRFGDNTNGSTPPSGTHFWATYRVGNGSVGNVGAESIAHIVASTGAITLVRNPMPAFGGVEPEAVATVRRRAPQAFRRQLRAVTLEDYATAAQEVASVQRAAAVMRWTGSWYTVYLTADPLAGADVTQMDADILDRLEGLRMAGVDLDTGTPHYVSLELGLHICVKDDYFRSDVKQRLLETFSNQRLPDGRLGLFHPDRYTFGQSVYFSQIYAAAHDVPGVMTVQVTVFQRQGTNDGQYLLSGELPIGPFEIARLDNDRNYPEHGVLRLDVHGGK